MSMRALQKAVQKSPKDEFPEGTVIRWVAADKYTYAALKTPVGWYTTSRMSNGFVPQVISFDQLMQTMSRAETSKVAVATEWKEIS